MKTSRNNRNNSTEVPKQKERHIVTWSQEEDDVLREQIRIHGTDNWAIIASRFKDKTTRQCRRRWYTYLNSDFKKGGWSPEEDMLLCEAQKIFGNRWTEIAKVVSGRTDNAVKNRFSTLCKKRAKHEALAKENNTSFVNLNNKRIIFRNRLEAEGIETTVPLKRRRSHIPEVGEDCNEKDRLFKECGTTNQLLRPPFAVLVQNFQNVSDLPMEHHSDNTMDATCDVSSNKIQGTYLKKDDPKIIALMQQAELLSSLALKVNTENTDQSLENAWKVLQDFLNQSKESDMLGFKITEMDFQLEDFKDLMEDLRSSNENSRPSWRQPDLYEESPESSEYSTGSTLVIHKTGDKTDENQAEVCVLHEDIEAELKSPNIEEPGLGECENDILAGGTTTQDVLMTSDELKTDDGAICELSNTEFSSPFQVTPLFRSLAAGIPSPQFSESERHFLLKTLGMESSSPDPSTKTSKPPPCKRILLNSL